MGLQFAVGMVGAKAEIERLPSSSSSGSISPDEVAPTVWITGAWVRSSAPTR